MSYEIMKEIAESRGDDLALVTVIEVQGSVPRHAGSKMLVRAGSSSHAMAGTVGGGKGEARAIATALECVRDRTPYRLALERLSRGERVLLGKTLHADSSVAVAVVDESGAALAGSPCPSRSRPPPGGPSILPRRRTVRRTAYSSILEYRMKSFLYLAGGTSARPLRGTPLDWGTL